MPDRSPPVGHPAAQGWDSDQVADADWGGDGGHGGNAPVLGVSELSRRVKGTIEDAFGYVRVRGEISRPSFPGSGHCYLRLKDDSAVLDGVIWRGTLAGLGMRPEEGAEVIVTGRLTTYPGRSSYQIVIERMELAGEGALLKLLEERRRKLDAEGLFAHERKRPLPFLPDVIGVVTSPTGAVIRDILHRLAERFPRRVLLWPVAVQGEGAAAQVAAAIEGFNRLPATGWPRRPDVLIVARGGGSLEDLWTFNEEVVVRAAAASAIPLISAVGHETDTTLIDHAADVRAPTPTAAAEMAVPVRADLAARVAEDGGRLGAAVRRATLHRQRELIGLGRGLTDPRRLLEAAWQRLDDRGEGLRRCMAAGLLRRAHALALAAGALKDPRQRLHEQHAALRLASQRLAAAERARTRAAVARLEQVAGRLTIAPTRREIARAQAQLPQLARRLEQGGAAALRRARDRLGGGSALLESLSYRSVLQRGYVVVRDADSAAVTDAGLAAATSRLWLEFAEGTDSVVPVAVIGPKSKLQPRSARRPRRTAERDAQAAARQHDLFGGGGRDDQT